MAEVTKSAPDALREEIEDLLASFRGAHTGWINAPTLKALRRAHERPGAYGPDPGGLPNTAREVVQWVCDTVGLSSENEAALATKLGNLLASECVSASREVAKERDDLRAQFEKVRAADECKRKEIKALHRAKAGLRTELRKHREPGHEDFVLVHSNEIRRLRQISSRSAGVRRDYADLVNENARLRARLDERDSGSTQRLTIETLGGTTLRPTLADAVRQAGLDLVVMEKPALHNDACGRPEPDAKAVVLSRDRVAATANDWGLAYDVAHEIAESQYGFRHCDDMFAHQANILAAWCRLLAGATNDPVLEASAKARSGVVDPLEDARKALAEAGVECETVAEGIGELFSIDTTRGEELRWAHGEIDRLRAIEDRARKAERELEAVMHFVDKWFDGDATRPCDPAQRANEAREIALKAIEKAEAAGGVGLLRRLRDELEASLSRDPEGDWDRAYDGSTKDSLASIDRLIAEAEAQPAEESEVDSNGNRKFPKGWVPPGCRPAEPERLRDTERLIAAVKRYLEAHQLPHYDPHNEFHELADAMERWDPKWASDWLSTARQRESQDREQHQGVGEEQGCPTRTQVASAEGRAPMATSPTPPSQPKREPQHGDDVLRAFLDDRDYQRFPSPLADAVAELCRRARR